MSLPEQIPDPTWPASGATGWGTGFLKTLLTTIRSTVNALSTWAGSSGVTAAVTLAAKPFIAAGATAAEARAAIGATSAEGLVVAVNGVAPVDGEVTLTPAVLEVVPLTRTVAGHALDADVTLAKGDVGLGNVDNTADSAKPVSTAQAAALSGKAPLNGGMWPTIVATAADTYPTRSTWIAAHCPGYEGPVVWLNPYPWISVYPSTAVDVDMILRFAA